MELELSRHLFQCQDIDARVRTEAEQWLLQAVQHAGFCRAALNLIMNRDPAALPAAITFKNKCKKDWEDENNAADPKYKIARDERDFVKTHLVRVMIEADAPVQRQLSETLAIIAESDFPAEWPQLLPELIAHISSPDYHKVRAVLQCCNTMFKPYRYRSKSDALWTQIKYVLVNFSQPLLETMQRVLADLTTTKTQDELLDLLRYVANIFLSLSSQDIPEQFEERLNDWMSGFVGLVSIVTPTTPAPRSASREEDMAVAGTPLELLQGVIIAVWTLYASKYESEFRAHIPTCVQCIWALLVSSSDAAPRNEAVVAPALQFLAVVIRAPWHRTLFSAPGQLEALAQHVILPNLRLSPADQDQFTVDPVEYVRKDSEGADQQTRRRLTCDLVRAIKVQFQNEITDILGKAVATLMQEYAISPATGWVSKDAAMYVVVALSVQGHTVAQGATQIADNIDVAQFYNQHVLTELTAEPMADFPILKADAIKFVIIFRSHLPVQQCRDLIPTLTRHLASPSFVVHSYAATAIERLLALPNIITRPTLQPHLSSLLTALFSALDHDESEENDYIMKAIMRVLHVGAADVQPFLDALLHKLTSTLVRVASNPRNPMFNHYLFECVAVLIRNTCIDRHDLVPTFQDAVIPPFKTMLRAQESCSEFGPYVFQILCQLLRYTGQALPPVFESMFPSVLAPPLWDSPGNVHALTLLIREYLAKPAFVSTLCAGDVGRGWLDGILGIFQKLIASKLNDKYGLQLLTSLVRTVPWDVLQPSFKQVLVLLFTRAQQSMTAQFGRSLCVFLSEMICVRGLPTLWKEIEALQVGLAVTSLSKLLLSHVGSVVDHLERKTVAVALVHAVGPQSIEVVLSAGPAGERFWADALDKLVDLLEIISGGADVATAADPAESILSQLEEAGGYSASYNRLAFASAPAKDPFPNTDVVQMFTQALAEASRLRPGKLQSVMGTHLPPARCVRIQEICSGHLVQLA
ncbi:Importin N-terminal domain-containing protein [Plasmodiophora brassicae]